MKGVISMLNAIIIIFAPINGWETVGICPLPLNWFFWTWIMQRNTSWMTKKININKMNFLSSSGIVIQRHLFVICTWHCHSQDSFLWREKQPLATSLWGVSRCIWGQSSTPWSFKQRGVWRLIGWLAGVRLLHWLLALSHASESWKSQD